MAMFSVDDAGYNDGSTLPRQTDNGGGGSGGGYDYGTALPKTLYDPATSLPAPSLATGQESLPGYQDAYKNLQSMPTVNTYNPAIGGLSQVQNPYYQAPTPTSGGAGDIGSQISGYYASRGVSPYPTSVDYWTQKWNEWGQKDPNYFWQRLSQADEFGGGGQASGGAPGAAPQGGGYAGGNPFDDPATKPFIDLLNQQISRLNTPYTPPDFQQAIDSLNGYLKTLQGPAYTPDQMGLMQTQVFDPVMQQRDQTRQQIIQHFAQQGVPPSSGIVQQALLQSDQNFEKLGTQQRANVANNAIGMQKQQFAQAAQLAPLIASLEQQNFNTNEGRANQAVNMAQIIPTMAWNRLQGAGNQIQQINPLSVLSQLNSFQTQGYDQGSNFASGLTSILPYLMNLFH